MSETQQDSYFLRELPNGLVFSVTEDEKHLRSKLHTWIVPFERPVEIEFEWTRGMWFYLLTSSKGSIMGALDMHADAILERLWPSIQELGSKH